MVNFTQVISREYIMTQKINAFSGIMLFTFTYDIV